ncbi:MAG: hypothetical protein IT559_04400 [Alphaproteobacteria bacterium]|nr:hypothetical protein [Alphaproteobacteria bacterium]
MTKTALHQTSASLNEADHTRSLIAALLTSQAAGLIMAVVVMAVFTLFLGKGPIYPVQVIGSIAFGEPALTGFNPAAFLTGLVVHQGVALAWGVVFWVFARTLTIQTVKQAVILGLSVAVLSMIDTYVLVPFAMKALHGMDIWNREVPIFWNWAAHIVFGLSYGLYPKILSKLQS